MYSILNGYSNNNYLASIINAAPPPLANLTKISDAESTSIVEILYFSGLTDESAASANSLAVYCFPFQGMKD